MARPIPTLLSELRANFAELETRLLDLTTLLEGGNHRPSRARPSTTPTTSTTPTPTEAAAARARQGITIHEGILSALSDHQAHNKLEIARAIREHPHFHGRYRNVIKSVGPRLSYMVQAGLIQRLPNGSYQKA